MPFSERPSSTWDLNPDTTLPRLLAANARVLPQAVAFREKDRGIWQETTWQTAFDKALRCAAGLQAQGLQKGHAVLILGDNRPHLYLGMLAVGMLGGFATPVYPDATPEEIMHVVNSVHVQFVLAEDQEQVDKALDLRERGASLQHIVYDNPRGLSRYTAPGLVSLQQLMNDGHNRLQSQAGLAQQLTELATPADPAVLIHSSGTTGKPKGVALSHRNVLSGVANAFRGQSFEFGEDILAYLPMAWIGDFAITMGAGVALHFSIHIPERPETVLHNLREIAPTFYLAAPRSWDNMLTQVQVRMEDTTWLKKKLYDFFMAHAILSEKRKLAGETPSTLQRLLRPFGEWLVTGPIKDQLGISRLRNAFTGGEAMGEDTFVFYRALGVRLRQFYGQTESSAFNAMQAPNEVRLHTVGRPLPDVEVKISDSGEILIRSGSVFSGYHQNEKATAETLTDGWLHTGDAGYLEPDGQLVVLGRVSEVVYTAKNERYIPNYIENRLKFSPFVKDVAVLGKGRDTLAAIVCIDKEPVGHWAEVRGISYISYADLSQKPEVIELLTQAVRHVNETLPEGLKLRHFVSLHKEFDADDGEITRTRKLRRNVVEERYAPIIEAIYGGQKQVTMRAQITYETGEIGVTERLLTVKEV
ncbi:AMP-dependent synthetase/ligase [Variovorax sp. DAIF25]|jgi:long-chain acyl-CoA synthetase|uniref:AMP-dependent synthetase/ligase n=1 Tax=Variovorax sp. DAIF25 TaxID=3080983 RepID=UPI003D6A306E